MISGFCIQVFLKLFMKQLGEKLGQTLPVQNVREMFIFFNVYNRLFQSAISLYMYLSSVNFHKPKRHFFFSTSEVVTNEC